MLNDQAFGVGQTWQSFTSGRDLNTTYTNSTSKPIMVSISCEDTINQAPTITIIVGGVTILSNKFDDGSNFGSFSHSFIVPSATSYIINSSVTVSFTWAEFR